MKNFFRSININKKTTVIKAKPDRMMAMMAKTDLLENVIKVVAAKGFTLLTPLDSKGHTFYKKLRIMYKKFNGPTSILHVPRDQMGLKDINQVEEKIDVVRYSDRSLFANGCALLRNFNFVIYLLSGEENFRAVQKELKYKYPDISVIFYTTDAKKTQRVSDDVHVVSTPEQLAKTLYDEFNDLQEVERLFR